MSNKFYPWSEFTLVGNEKKYLIDALESTWVSGGPYVERLEIELDKIFVGSKCFSVANGTLALQLAFQLLNVKPHERVIVPSFGFQAAGNVLHQLGVKPIFCEVDPLTWNQSLKTIIESVDENTVGIVVVHNYGMSAPIEQIVKWARKNGLWVIEDCAEAWFTKHSKKYVGQHGDIATFSMHATKTISSGEGGVVLINNDKYTDELILRRSHGMNRSKAHYYHEIAGNNYRLSNLLAAIALAQLECRNELESRQRKRRKAYEHIFKKNQFIQVQGVSSDSDDVLWANAIKIDTEKLKITRNELMLKLRDQGVDTRPGFVSATLLPYNFNIKTKELKNSENLTTQILVPPCSMGLKYEDVLDIGEKIIKTIDQNIK